MTGAVSGEAQPSQNFWPAGFRRLQLGHSISGARDAVHSPQKAASPAFSIFVAAWSLFTQRKHNLKSVAPFAEITIGDYENRLEISFRNAGPGPLIVEKFRAFNESEERNDLVSWMPEPPTGLSWTTFTGDLTDRCLSPNEKRVILQLDGDPRDPSFALFRDTVRQALSGLHVEVSYRDIYNKLHRSRGRSLQWFGRLLNP